MLYILVNVYNVPNTSMHIYSIILWEKYLHLSGRETEALGYEMMCVKAYCAEKLEPSTKVQCFMFIFFPSRKI